VTVLRSDWLDQYLANVGRIDIKTKLDGLGTPGGYSVRAMYVGEEFAIILETLYRKGDTVHARYYGQVSNEGLGERVAPKQDEERDEREVPFHGLGWLWFN
jgi:hypothetical protein